MSSSGQTNTNTVIPLTAFEDHSASRGYAVKLSAGVGKLPAAATDLPYAIILDGVPANHSDSVAVLGGNIGFIKVKAGGAVTNGSLGQMTAAGAFINDTGAGARVLAVMFMEDGAQDELVKALTFKPVYAHAVVLTSTNGTAAGAADLAALKAETENIGDDVRAIYAALKAEGLLG